MSKRISVVLGTILVVLLALSIGAAIAKSGSDLSTSTTSTTSPTSTTLPARGNAETTVYEVGDAGTVTVASDGASLSIVAAEAAQGWVSEVEVAAGREVEADFRNGSRRIQFNAELEDGEVRNRVRDGADDNGGADGSTSASTTIPASSGFTSTTMPSAANDSGSSVTYKAGGGGTVTIASSGSSLTIVSVDPSVGWASEVEVASGREVEADFRNGSRRIQFNAELEDGEVRIRVRDGADDNS
ncbi:MAG: hypothetical protein OEY62_10310 [Acidimicrobiia bacterium]|nr:hypothetical protein [Acidimicrobiia bacterium]